MKNTSGYIKFLPNLTLFARPEIRRPRRNRRKINPFHHRNQITNAHVQTRSVKS
jgi:hypothetical protein